MMEQKLSPTGRLTKTSPELQRIRVPLTEAQREEVAALKRAHAPDPLNLRTADFAALELRLMAGLG
jgi:DNA polymerase I-like protein with 3'-5' exonuclease and polymerase domains